MPSQRAPDQKQVIVIMRDAFLDEIDRAVNQLGFNDRASLIRTAVYEKLQKDAAIDIPIALTTAPSRAGKGGRPKKTKDSKPPVKMLAAEPEPTYTTNPKK